MIEANTNNAMAPETERVTEQSRDKVKYTARTYTHTKTDTQSKAKQVKKTPHTHTRKIDDTNNTNDDFSIHILYLKNQQSKRKSVHDAANSATKIVLIAGKSASKIDRVNVH